MDYLCYSIFLYTFALHGYIALPMKTLFILLSMIATTYSSRTFHTEKTFPINASADSVQIVLDRFVYELQTDPNQLFDWVFAGTGSQGDTVKDAMQLVFHESRYVAEERHGYLNIDVKTNGKVRFKNMVLETWAIDSLCNNTRNLSIKLDVSGRLIDDANMNFHVTPTTDSTSIVAFDSHIRFGWFFNLFISRRTYRNVIEWRFDTFLENLKRFTETGSALPPEGMR